VAPRHHERVKIDLKQGIRGDDDNTRAARITSETRCSLSPCRSPACRWRESRRHPRQRQRPERSVRLDDGETRLADHPFRSEQRDEAPPDRNGAHQLPPERSPLEHPADARIDDDDFGVFPTPQRDQAVGARPDGVEQETRPRQAQPADRTHRAHVDEAELDRAAAAERDHAPIR
jgi:hypothetical protein